jgi:hypothetical protein
MSERADEDTPGVGRRRFMLAATNAFGVTALAGWLAGPGVAGAAAPSDGQAATALGAVRTTQFTIHQDAPTITAVDGPGENLGDALYFHADLRLVANGDVVGHVFGVKRVIRNATEAEPGIEQRITHLYFASLDRQHQVIVAGVVDYPPDSTEFEPGRPVSRVLLGGTGDFIGVRGQLTSTRLPAGGYTQVFTVLE